MRFLASIALAQCVLGKRVEVHQDPLEVPGTFGANQFPASDKQWSLAPLQDFIEDPTQGMAGEDFVATGSPITLDVIRTKRFGLLTWKHAHYVFLQDGKAVSWMRAKFNVVSGYDWDLLPGQASLVKEMDGLFESQSPEAKELRLAKAKGIVFPMNPTYFAKVYIVAPKSDKKAKDVYYTITHLNPISKGMKDFGESHIRITRGWCNNAAASDKCKTDVEVVCTFLHKSCVLKTKSGEEIGSIERIKKGILGGGNYRIIASEGDALLFAQIAGFLDMASDLKRAGTLGPLAIPSNVLESAGGDNSGEKRGRPEGRAHHDDA